MQQTESPSPEALQPGEQLRLALVYGEAVTELPLDLYIPPDALEEIGRAHV